MNDQLKTMVAQLDSTCNDRYEVIKDIAERCTQHLTELNDAGEQEVERMKNGTKEEKEMYAVLLTFSVEMGRIIDLSLAEASNLMRSKLSAFAESSDGALLAAHAVRRCEMNLYCDRMKAAWHNLLALSSLKSQLLASVREVTK